MVQLRDYQRDAVDAVQCQATGNTLLVLPTGGGKTVIFTSLAREYAERGERVMVIAHRHELIGQISCSLARAGVPHAVVGDAAACVRLQMADPEINRSWVRPGALVTVAGVDRLAKRTDVEPDVRQWIMDEAHHLLTGNKWGKAIARYPNARGLGVTATPLRADGKGLGRHADGVFDRMVVGPSGRALIGQGYLCDYRIFAPPSGLDLSHVPVTASGDYSPPKLDRAVQRSSVHGDVVTHYLKIAPGKRGITFATSVAAATDLCQRFREAGVPAELITAKTDPWERAATLARFRTGSILQLVNVDLFGEGFDLPALEVVSMARPTMSYGLYAQQFGRALRPMPGKGHAIILDHVGNVRYHGLPDSPREWTMDRRERRSKAAPPAIRVCPECTGVYERYIKPCPYCGFAPIPTARSTPADVEGDLTEMDPVALAALRGEVDAPPKIPYGAEGAVLGAILKRDREKRMSQESLRHVMALWGGARLAAGDDLRAAQMRFFNEFQVDVLTAQTLGAAKAQELQQRIEKWT